MNTKTIDSQMTLELLKENLIYDPVSGKLSRVSPVVRGVKTSERPNKTIMVGSRVYSRSQVCWSLGHQEIPRGKVYFVNGDCHDYSLNNLTKVKPYKPRNKILEKAA